MADWATVKYVTPAVITRLSVNQTNAVGPTASFAVEVAGNVPLSYQCRRQGTNLVDAGCVSGVTTTNLLFANVQLADVAGYSVVVTNAYGSVTSIVVQLTVTIPPNPGRFTRLSYSPDTGFVSFSVTPPSASVPHPDLPLAGGRQLGGLAELQLHWPHRVHGCGSHRGRAPLLPRGESGNC